MKYLITGGCGFLGCNIAEKLINRGEQVIIFDNLSRYGSVDRLKFLEDIGEFIFINGDVRNKNDVDGLVSELLPDVVYHLAGQVAMTTSISNPRLDFEINTLGSFNLLEAVRIHSPESIIIFSSTNKIYGDLDYLDYSEDLSRYSITNLPFGLNEDIKLDFHSPYGNSKGSADQYMLDYARIYKLKTVVFRHSSIYGSNQYSSYDQGWVGWFINNALQILNDRKTNKPLTISGNGKQVRDLLFISDCVSLYIDAPQKIDTIKGQAFNIGGGVKNSSSIIELFLFLENELNIKIKYEELPFRISDQKVFIADYRKIEKFIGWSPKVSKEEGIRKMIQWAINKN